MRNFFTIAFLSLFLVFSAVKPAEAGLKLDFSMVMSKVSGFVQKISEGAQKVTQQINHVKKMASQGFNLDGIKQKAQGYLKNLKNQGQAFAVNFLKSQLRMLIASAAKQRAEEKAAAKDLYKDALKQKYQAQLDLIDENQSQLDSEIAETNSKISAQKSECSGLKSGAESGDADAITQYSDCMMELTRLEEDKKSYQELKETLNKEKQQTSKLVNQVGTAQDAEYKANQKREDEVKRTQAEERTDPVTTNPAEKEEWDSVDISKFNKPEEYEKFARQYFYDPNAVNQSDGAIVHQSNIDRITRDRRYLFINTATHLMQVATTARYEKEKINKAVKEMQEGTGTGSGTTEQIQAFSLTRWQNIKALLLYARIMSAKLQYLAARGLLTAELQKDLDNNPDYSQFNLEVYDLTTEYVKELYDRQSTLKRIGEK